jgi:hypothetical protein
MHVPSSSELVYFWPFSRHLKVRNRHASLVETVIVASGACLVKHRLVVTIRSAKRILTIANLPCKVTAMTRVMSVWNLNVRWKPCIDSRCLRNGHLRICVVTTLIIMNWRVTILIITILSLRSMYSTTFNWVWMLMLTRAKVLSKYHDLFPVEIALVA